MKFMKGFAGFCMILAAIASALPAKAQYYAIANQIPSLISPALSGSLAYKGFVEMKGLAGVGTNRANFVGISTSQGYQYSSWFFMGVGVGVDAVIGRDDRVGFPGDSGYNHTATKTMCMIPVFTDIRLKTTSDRGPAFFLGVKFGASWLIGSNYLQLSHGYLTTATQFYLVPQVGVRFPISAANPRQAVNFGLTYQLLTANNNYYYYNDNSLSLNSFGLTIGYEW